MSSSSSSSSAVGPPPTIAEEPSLSISPEDGSVRLSCRAYETDVVYKGYFRPAEDDALLAPDSVNDDTESELILNSKTAGYYFCVIKSRSSGKFTVSQIIPVFLRNVYALVSSKSHLIPFSFDDIELRQHG